MVSDHDTEELTGSSREKTDPGFPGPGSNERQRAVPQAEVSPHEVRVSDTLPAAAKAGAVEPSPAPMRPVSHPPPKPARAESIDELLDGLAGEGHLPRKSSAKPPPVPPRPAMPKSESALAAAPRPPAPKGQTPEDLPSVLVQKEAAPPAANLEPLPPSDLDDNDGDRRSDATVLTPISLARRMRLGTVIAAVLGVVVAVGVLAFVRQVTHSSDDETVPAATAVSPGAKPATNARAIPQNTTERQPSAAPNVPTNAAAPTGASPQATPSGARLPPPLPPVPQRPGSPAPSNTSLDEFRKTIRQ
jgi:hypothetical protein